MYFLSTSFSYSRIRTKTQSLSGKITYAVRADWPSRRPKSLLNVRRDKIFCDHFLAVGYQCNTARNARTYNCS